MPDAPHGSRDLSALIRMSLSKDGEGTKADAFSRWLSQRWAFRLDQHSVAEMLDKFSFFLGQVRGDRAISIVQDDDPRDTVVVISVSQLAKALGSVASELEYLSRREPRDPITMFSAMDRLPEVSETEAIIPRRPRHKHLTLNLD
jgi:hypothetical protein